MPAGTLGPGEEGEGGRHRLHIIEVLRGVGLAAI